LYFFSFLVTVTPYSIEVRAAQEKSAIATDQLALLFFQRRRASRAHAHYFFSRRRSFFVFLSFGSHVPCLTLERFIPQQRVQVLAVHQSLQGPELRRKEEKTMPLVKAEPLHHPLRNLSPDVWLGQTVKLSHVRRQHAWPWRYPRQAQQDTECLELGAAQFVTPARIERKERERVAFHDAYTGPHRYQGWGPASRQSSLQLSGMLLADCPSRLWISSSDFA